MKEDLHMGHRFLESIKLSKLYFIALSYETPCILVDQLWRENEKVAICTRVYVYAYGLRPARQKKDGM